MFWFKMEIGYTERAPLYLRDQIIYQGMFDSQYKRSWKLVIIANIHWMVTVCGAVFSYSLIWSNITLGN